MMRTDVTIIGAGPAGLFAAFYVGMRNLSVRIIDPLPEPGGQLSALYPEKYIYDIAGFPKVLAKDIVANLVEQLEPFKPVYNLGERAEKLEEDNGDFVIQTSAGHSYRTGSIVIAAGVGAFEPRKIGCPGEGDFVGHGVYYAVKSPEEFRGKRVLIVGGGDSAVDWTLGLKDRAQVTTIHRRDAFRAHGATVNQMRAAAEAGEIRLLTPYEVKSIEGDGQVRRATIFHNQTKEETVLELDAVIILAGYLSKLGPLAGWGLELEGNKIKVNSKMETSRPGIFGCGDIVTYPGKLPLIALGFGEASIAANHAAAYANPALKVNPGHSSEKADHVTALAEKAVVE
ncbi:MAG TPA: NAD(P)/FAD-dependent oxidoreductase [Meiothermus sp.]|nr:NAD(P)/FAD-dependent oxidoreductase [Meiothermus sp.]